MCIRSVIACAHEFRSLHSRRYAPVLTSRFCVSPSLAVEANAALLPALSVPAVTVTRSAGLYQKDSHCGGV